MLPEGVPDMSHIDTRNNASGSNALFEVLRIIGEVVSIVGEMPEGVNRYMTYAHYIQSWK